MTAPPVGLPEPVRDGLALELQRRLNAHVGDNEAAAQACGELLDTATSEHGDAAAFELAYAAVLIVTGGNVATRATSPLGITNLRYGGVSGSDGGEKATPDFFRREEFATAAINGRRGQAWQAWRRMTPPSAEGLSPAATEMLGKLIVGARNRVQSGKMVMELTADRWPPICDFCSGPTASWMWHVEPADVEIPDPRPHMAGSTLQISMEDIATWFACRSCKPLVARPKPMWPAVLRRRQRVGSVRGESVMALYKIFERNRRSWMPGPLPATRPIPGSYDEQAGPA